MEPSETAERTSSQREMRSIDLPSRIRAFPPPQTVRAFLAIEAASFLLAASIHAGGLVHGYDHHEAMMAERIIGAVLLAGLATTWLRPRLTSPVALGVQAFALLGTLVGIGTIVAGFGPRTVPDIVYHVAIVVVLAVGIGIAWRMRGSDLN